MRSLDFSLSCFRRIVPHLDVDLTITLFRDQPMRHDAGIRETTKHTSERFVVSDRDLKTETLGQPIVLAFHWLSGPQEQHEKLTWPRFLRCLPFFLSLVARCLRFLYASTMPLDSRRQTKTRARRSRIPRQTRSCVMVTFHAFPLQKLRAAKPTPRLRTRRRTPRCHLAECRCLRCLLQLPELGS